MRWRAGQWLLGLAALLALVALTRPLGPEATPRMRLLVTLLLALGLGASALLFGLKGSKHWERWALYTFLVLGLDGLGQMLGAFGWPAWPLLALALGALAVAEPPSVALTFVALACALAAADAAKTGFTLWKPALAASLGYAGLVLTLQTAQSFERKKLKTALDEADRLRFGFEEGEPGGRAEVVGTSRLLRRVSEPGRRALQKERGAELESLLRRLVEVARASVKAHAVTFFEIDREREVARLRAWSGPASLKSDAAVPLGQDPFAFVVDRGVPFYATDFKRLLWELPYYGPGTKLGTLLAVPVLLGSVVHAVLIADRVEIQSLTGDEPDVLAGFAGMCADAVAHTRAAVDREEVGLEFHAVYRVSERLARATKAQTVRKILLDYARKLVDFEGAAFVMTDEAQTRYKVIEAHGWAQSFEGREVGLMERTWAAWVLRGGDQSLLIDDLADQKEKMPILVLDEDKSGAASLLVVPLRVGLGELDALDDEDAAVGLDDDSLRDPVQRISLIGAFVLTGQHGAFDATSRRVLGLFANQAAATLYHISLKETERSHAARDGLTGLYNRRAFDELLQQARAVEERRPGGRLSLLLLDLDHFKQLNDSYGHPAGDAALRATARTIHKVIRGADIAARYGGEEFVVIMPSTDEAGALRTAERLRRALEREQLIYEAARISVTASLGVAEWPKHGKEPSEALAAADRALYAAKQAGRNRAVGASSLPAPALEPARAEAGKR